MIFKVNDRVGTNTSRYYDNYDYSHTGPLRYNDDDSPEYGVVTDVLSSGNVLVKWDSAYRNREQDYSGPQDPTKLALEEDVKNQYSILEQEFKVVSLEVKTKLEEIADSIRQANEISKSIGRPLAQMPDVYGTIYQAMDEAGWNTSSFGC